MKKQVLTLTFFTIIAITSCTTQSVEKQIAQNPDILFKAIENNPKRFMIAVQNAAIDARKQAEKDRLQEQERQTQAAIDNPLNPDIQKDEAVLNPENAPLTLVAYSDFECPYCSQGSATVNSLLQKYKGKIRFVYKHLPLKFHPHALIAAKYFEAIKLQDPQKAFKFHNEVFAMQSKLKNGEHFLKEVSKSTGVDMKKLIKDIQSKEVLATIERHKEEAQKFKIQGTPGFILNGIPIKGAYPIEHFVSLIDKLKEKGKLTI